MKRNMIAVGCVLAAAGMGASGEVLYDNFGAGDTYSLDRGWTISYGGPLAGAVWEQAVAFTVTGGDYYFDSADLAVLNNYGPDLVYLDLHADAGGNVGAVLESTSASGVTDPFVYAEPMHAAFSGTTLLEDGQTYWLSLRTDQTDALASWAFNVIDEFGLRAYQLDGGGWMPEYGVPGTDSQRGVFRINATAVPAPGVPGVALLACAGFCRRRRA